MPGRRHRRLRATERFVLVEIPLAMMAAVTVAPGVHAVARATPAPRQWQLTTLPAPTGGVASSFAEPGIVIGSDGTALVNAATANTGAPPSLWLSRDGATTWSSARDFDATGASSGDADAAIGSDGYLYALNLGYSPNPPAQPTNPTVLVYRSQNGLQWMGPATFPPPHGIDQPDRPWLVVDPRHPADVDVVNSEGGGNVVMWRSTDHGASFAGPTTVTSGANSEVALALSSRPLFDPSDDGRIFMLYETASPAGVAATEAGSTVYEFPMTQIWLAESPDAGVTWSNTKVLDTAALPGPMKDGAVAHLLVASAIDRSGNLFAAFSMRPGTGTTTHIEVIHSTDHGRSWSVPAEIGGPMASNVMPALAASSDGNLDVSWYGSPAPDFRDSTARWAEMFAESADPLSGRPAFVVSQVTGGRPVHVGAIDAAGAVGSDLGDNWGLRDFQGLAMDGYGRPHPVWADDGRRVTQTATGTVASLAPMGGSPNTVAGSARGGVPALAVSAVAIAVAQRLARRRNRDLTSA